MGHTVANITTDLRGSPLSHRRRSRTSQTHYWGGIYYSLLAGSIAFKPLDSALTNNDLSKTQLKTYEQDWKKLLTDDMKVGHWAKRMFESISDDQIDTLIETISRNGLRKDILDHKDFSFDWHGRVILQELSHPLLSPVIRVLNPLAVRIASKIVAH